MTRVKTSASQSCCQHNHHGVLRLSHRSHFKGLSYFHLFFPNGTNLDIVWISQWKRTSIKSLKPGAQCSVGRQLCRARTGTVPVGAVLGDAGCTGDPCPVPEQGQPSAVQCVQGSTQIAPQIHQSHQAAEGTCRRDHVEHSWNTPRQHCSALEHPWHRATKIWSF